MYSGYDLKDCRYFSTGRNARSYRECFEAIKSLLVIDSLIDWDELPESELLNFFNIRIENHRKRIDIGTGEIAV